VFAVKAEIGNASKMQWREVYCRFLFVERRKRSGLATSTSS